MENVFDKEYYVVYEDDSLISFQKRKKMYEQEYKRIAKLIPDCGKILDYGCGIGNFLLMFDERWQKYGVEISDYAKSVAASRGINFLITEADEGTFDLVIFRGSISYMKYKEEVLEYAKRMLKAGGYIVLLSVPDPSCLCYRKFHTMPMLEKDKEHFLTNIREMKAIFNSLHMKVIKVYKPYFKTPYAKPLHDMWYFYKSLIKPEEYNFAFYGNLYEMYARKADK